MPIHEPARHRANADPMHSALTAAGGKLIYVVGPSGSGKDSVIGYARERLGPESNVRFARRTITRPSYSGHEDHLAVTPQEFESMLSRGDFAMHWRANGLAYGVGREILAWIADGACVVVSGSRAHLPEVLAAFSAVQVVHVTAAPEALRERLRQRGRESEADIEARLARAAALELPPGVRALRIGNDGRLEAAGRALLEYLSPEFDSAGLAAGG